MKIYIAGKITGLKPIEYGHRFGYIASKLRLEGNRVINPAAMLSELNSEGFEHSDLMHICYAAIDVCDAVYMLSNWYESKGAKMEHQYALDKGKKVIYQGVTNENKKIQSYRYFSKSENGGLGERST